MAAANTAGTGPSPVPAVLLSAEASGRSVLLEHEVYALLAGAGAGAGVGVPRHRLLARPDEAGRALCEELGSEDAVVKIASPDLLHKSDVGGVVVCRNEPAAVRGAVERVLASARAASPSARIAGALVVERVRFRAGTGRELLGSFRHDTAFGPVVVLGVGGLDTEALLGALKPSAARAMLAAEGLTAEAALARLRGTLVHEALTGRLRSSRGHGVPEERLAELAAALARSPSSWAGFEPAGGLGLVGARGQPVRGGRGPAARRPRRAGTAAPASAPAAGPAGGRAAPPAAAAERRRDRRLRGGDEPRPHHPAATSSRAAACRATGSGRSTRRPGRSTAAARTRRSRSCRRRRTSRSCRSRRERAEPVVRGDRRRRAARAR